MSSHALLLGRTGGDRRWCYRGDASGADPDGLGECDVRKLRDALVRHRYAPPNVIGAAESLGDILDRLVRTARRCAGGDTLVFYFSGHAKYSRNGLDLILGWTDDRPDTLAVKFVIETLLDASPASSKLLILDCCHAGEAALSWCPGIYENLRILAAVDPHHRAKEHPQVGGLFTHCLCQALTEPGHWCCVESGLIDPEGRIWSDRLSGWLRPEVARLAGK